MQYCLDIQRRIGVSLGLTYNRNHNHTLTVILT